MITKTGTQIVISSMSGRNEHEVTITDETGTKVRVLTGTAAARVRELIEQLAE